MLTTTRRTTTIRPTISCSRSPAWKTINKTAQFYSNKSFSPKPLPEISIQDWTNFQSLSLACKPGTKIFQLCFALALHLRYSFFLAFTIVLFHLAENSQFFSSQMESLLVARMVESFKSTHTWGLKRSHTSTVKMVELLLKAEEREDMRAAIMTAIIKPTNPTGSTFRTNLKKSKETYKVKISFFCCFSLCRGA